MLTSKSWPGRRSVARGGSISALGVAKTQTRSPLRAKTKPSKKKETAPKGGFFLLSSKPDVLIAEPVLTSGNENDYSDMGCSGSRSKDYDA